MYNNLARIWAAYDGFRTIEEGNFRGCTMTRLTVFSMFLLVATDNSPDQAKKDRERLQGAWVMAALEVDGKLVPADKLKDTTLLIKGNKYITRVKDRQFETTFTLDPGKSPRAIDMVFTDGANKGQVLKGIYSVEGDTLKVCRGLQPKQDRPTQFGTWPNTGLFLVTWKRQQK